MRREELKQMLQRYAASSEQRILPRLLQVVEPLELLQFAAEGNECGPLAAEFIGHRGRRSPSRNPGDDDEQLRRAPSAFFKRCAFENIEEGAAGDTFVVQNRGSIFPANLAIIFPAIRAWPLEKLRRVSEANPS